MAFAAETICVQGSNERKDPFGAISMPIIRMRRMRIRAWGRVRDMIIPAAATPPETKCRRRLLCWNREQRHWHFLREWRQSLQ